MAAKFTPRLVGLTYEAALKSYWRKEALKKFLPASYVSENFLATWGEGSGTWKGASGSNSSRSTGTCVFWFSSCNA